MKKIMVLLSVLSLLLGLVACSSAPVSSGSEASAPKEECAYKVGDVVDFGDYEWRVLDVKGDKALLLTEEIIALDFINISEKAIEEIDGIAAKHPYAYDNLSDYEGWNVFTDDDVFSEGDSFYDNWQDLLNKNSDTALLDTSDLRKSTNWANCSLRNKLNNEMRFSDEEWAQIVETEVIDPSENGEATYDKVFLLTTEQIKQYFPRNEDRGAKGTRLSDEELLRYLKRLHVTGNLSGQLAEFALALPDGGVIYWWTIGETAGGLFGAHTGVEEQLNDIAPALPIAGVRPAIWVSANR